MAEVGTNTEVGEPDTNTVVGEPDTNTEVGEPDTNTEVGEPDTNGNNLANDDHNASTMESAPRTPQDDMAELTLLADHTKGAEPIIRCEEPFTNQQADVPPPEYKFFVGGLGPSVEEADLITYFANFGRVSATKVVVDANTGVRRGFGFVTMETQEAFRAIFASRHVIGGRVVNIRRLQTDSESIPRKIFVGGLNPALSEVQVECYFSRFGHVEDVTILRMPTSDGTLGRSRGFGFVLFAEDDSARRCLLSRTHMVTPNDRVDIRPAEARSRARRQQDQPVFRPEWLHYYPQYYNLYAHGPFAGQAAYAQAAYGQPPFGQTYVPGTYIQPSVPYAAVPYGPLPPYSQTAPYDQPTTHTSRAHPYQ